jgi:exodeoxyribonuclease VII large subunit
MHEVLTISKLNDQIGKVLSETFVAPVWVTAEINHISLNRSGHCYLELIDKNEKSDNITAQARGTIWANTFRMLKPFFEQTTGQVFTEGIKVLIKTKVNFHKLYGLSLNIIDIDPSYTLGDLARRRKEILKKLEATGMMELNKSHVLPAAIKRIAIISSATAAGYEDFLNELNINEYKYKFDCTLFEAFMQGNKTESSLISALNCINDDVYNYDVVAILRGGGSKADLSAFDNFEIASYIMQFPIPVFTGIGHERDESVCDIVANLSLKTPTATADFIVSHNRSFEENIEYFFNSIHDYAQEYLSDNKLLIKDISTKISLAVPKIIKNENDFLNKISYHSHIKAKNFLKSKEIFLNNKTHLLKTLSPSKILQKREQLNNLQHWLGNSPISMIRHKKSELDRYSQLIRITDPAQVLKRGYSITSLNGKAMKSANEITKGSILQTKLYNGIVYSKVENIK